MVTTKQQDAKRVVVVGGGTGTYTLLQGLRTYVPELALTAVVSMADNGGSTGRLRTDFNQLPIGDVRQALVALADNRTEQQQLLQALCQYRFSQSDGLAGHNLGNLLLTALTDSLGSETAAIAAMSTLLGAVGTVLPVSLKPTHLVATYDSGETVFGEHQIDEQTTCVGEAINELRLEPSVTLNPAVGEALRTADMIVFGPGDLYTSVVANCIVDGFKEAVQASGACRVYVLNLMGKACQTTHLDAAGHVRELESYLGCELHHILAPTTLPDEEVLVPYQKVGDVVVDVTSLGNDERVVRRDIVARECIASETHDAVARSYVRHDSYALAAVIQSLL